MPAARSAGSAGPAVRYAIQVRPNVVQPRQHVAGELAGLPPLILAGGLTPDNVAGAIRLAREHGGVIHLLITDVVMPEMNGRDLARNLLSLYPEIKRLFMSGYTADVIAHHGIGQ